MGDSETARSTFGKWLRQKRRALDLTQEAFADQVSCARITLRRIESDALKPSKELALVLLEKVGIPKSDCAAWLPFARGLGDPPVKQTIPLPAPIRNNLPASLTTFIGREKEQADVINLITKNRLVTLTGSGGVGKTRLSIQAAAELLTEYPIGVWLVELAPLTDPALVPQSVCAVMGVKPDGDTSALEALTNYLRNKKLLLVLDNCEHLIDACAQLCNSLLRSCPDLRILASSREALGIDGEQSYRVPSLSLPNSKIILNIIQESEAVTLFVERAASVQPEFALTETNAPFIAQICQRLDGIALAIELAASRVKMFKVEQIAARLDDAFGLLTSGNRTALPRQQTLRALIDWSYNLLSEEEKTFLRKLSVFMGGWTLEAAEAVCGNADALDLLTHLVDKSLVSVDLEHGNEPRYYLLETIRQYAQEKLISSDELNMLYHRHQNFFAELAIEAEIHFKSRDQALWYDLLDNELDNLRIALTSLEGDVNASLILRFASSMWRYWKNRGYHNEGGEHFKRILGRFSTDIYREPQAYARVLNSSGALAYQTGDITYSEERRIEALEIFRKLDDKVGIADCLNGLGNTAISQGNYDSARSYYEESLDIRKTLEDKTGIARILGNLGLLAYFQMDYVRSYFLHMESLMVFRELLDNEGIRHELFNLGDVFLSQRDLINANSFYQESALIAMKTKDQWGLAYANKGMADVTFEQGNYSEAAALYRKCLLLCQKGVDADFPFVLESVANFSRTKNQPEKAARILGWAAAFRMNSKLPLPAPNQSNYQLNLSILHQQLESSKFEDAWAKGQCMSQGEVLTLAMEILQ
ncbi:MAG: tetratricopeptide repeat protein [Chloroflexi bacterium]|nr:tetratricopeptide repeat protein [Chloroflexota bacterium]